MSQKEIQTDGSIASGSASLELDHNNENDARIISRPGDILRLKNQVADFFHTLFVFARCP